MKLFPKAYNLSLKRRRWPAILAAAVLVIIAGVLIAAYAWLNLNLRPVSNSQTAQLFTVDQGSSARQIADGLKSLGLIKNSQAFILYIDIRHYKNKLQAGTYKLKPAMSAQEIAVTMANGYIDKNWITILPAKRLDQVKQVFLQVGYSGAQVDNAFNPANYQDEPIIADLPAGASLEGLLYPDSFEKAAGTPAQTIVRESLEEMQQKLTPDIISGFSAQGLNTYQGITLASIVYQESGDPASEPMVAQVFLSRLKQGMMLGSDVTAFYAAALAGQDHSLGVDSPYNTRLNTGLPPGPIGNMVESALEAVAHPSNTDYLYFVAGDDGTLHFSHTEAEHEQAVAQYCHKACAQ